MSVHIRPPDCRDEGMRIYRSSYSDYHDIGYDNRSVNTPAETDIDGSKYRRKAFFLRAFRQSENEETLRNVQYQASVLDGLPTFFQLPSQILAETTASTFIIP